VLAVAFTVAALAPRYSSLNIRTVEQCLRSYAIAATAMLAALAPLFCVAGSVRPQKSPSTGVNPLRVFVESIKDIARLRDFALEPYTGSALALFPSYLLDMAGAFLSAYLVYMMKSLGLNSSELAWLGSSLLVSQAAAYPLVGLLNRFIMMTLIRVYPIVRIATVVLLFHAVSTHYYVVAVVLYSLGNRIIFTSFTAYAMNILKREYLGRGLAAFRTALLLVTALSPLALGQLMSYISRETLVLILIVITLLMQVFVLRLKPLDRV